MNNTNDIQEELVTKVMEALDSIRPFLNKDGGDRAGKCRRQNCLCPFVRTLLQLWHQ